MDRCFPEAFDWFSLSAEQGNRNAMLYLGEMYRNGYGIQRDYQKACKWYRAAAKEGHGHARMNLGRMYMEGKGVKADREKAEYWMEPLFMWYETAAHMGYMYEDGWPMIESMEDAIWWYRYAADQGDANGICNLGNLYC